MGSSLTIARARQQVRFLLKKRKFEQTLLSNSIELDWSANRSQYAIFEDVFRRRSYSDFFPFYQNTCILDIGAHWGYFSIFANHNTGPDTKVTAVEPSSLNFKMLLENIARSKSAKVSAFRFAVAASNGDVALRMGYEANNSLALLGAVQGGTGVSEMVEAVTLQNLVARCGHDRIGFLKMDCEGAEYQILQTASNACLSKIDVISMEFHDLKSESHNGEFLYRRLSEAGFSIKLFSYSPTGLGLNYGRLIGSRIH